MGACCATPWLSPRSLLPGMQDGHRRHGPLLAPHYVLRCNHSGIHGGGDAATEQGVVSHLPSDMNYVEIRMTCQTWAQEERTSSETCRASRRLKHVGFETRGCCLGGPPGGGCRRRRRGGSRCGRVGPVNGSMKRALGEAFRGRGPAAGARG